MVDTTADHGPDTLRQAILESDASPGGNTIDFDIPGNGPWTINLASSLPAITGIVTIDGTSQPGYAATQMIRLGGTLAGVTVGLAIASPASSGPGGSGTSLTVRGLAIDGLGIDASQGEQLTARAVALQGTAELSLSSQGRVLVQSDGMSIAAPSIDEDLAAGSYSLNVETTGRRLHAEDDPDNRGRSWSVTGHRPRLAVRRHGHRRLQRRRHPGPRGPRWSPPGTRGRDVPGNRRRG